MKLHWNQISITRIGRMLPLLVILTALLAASPSQALAGGGHYKNKHGYKHGHGNGHGHGYSHQHGYPSRSYVVVPRQLYVEDRAYYRPYYTASRYYGPHHHYHAAYAFPVYVDGGVVVRPYSYCGDAIFYPAPYVAPVPRLAFGVTFGAPVGYVQPGFSGSFVYVRP